MYAACKHTCAADQHQKAHVVWVVACGAQIRGVAKQKYEAHIDERMAGSMQGLSGGQPPLCHPGPCQLRHPDAGYLQAMHRSRICSGGFKIFNSLMCALS